MVTRALSAACAALLFAPLADAQWNPSGGQYGKEVSTDLRVMTWNVEDALCRTNDKTESGGVVGNWEACARIVAAMKPDVLLLQETADNSGNGTGSNADSQSQLATVLDLFVNGGSDPFEGGSVTAFVRKYDPSLSYPFIYASADTDGFNRNAVISRYPFVDLNGDGNATASDMPIFLGDKYAIGFDGGIRGWINAEIDLPDATYAGDLVIGNSHFKAGGSSSDQDQRIRAAQNIAYFIDHIYNGAGTGTVDPNDVIFDNVTMLLDEDTVVITGGDLNQDESGASKGPVAWVAEAAVAGGTSDGTDRDGSDMTFDAATDPFTGNDATIGSSSKLDYLLYQDSIASSRREFVFNTSTVTGGGGQQPPEIASAFFSNGLSGIAADHRPVVVDFILPLGGGDPGCNTSAVDLGFALTGSNGNTPNFEVCGDLVSGSTADFILSDAPLNQNAFPVIAFAASPTPFKGGTLVPIPPIVLDPLFTGFVGGVTIPNVDGGLGPFTLIMQWVITDPGLPKGFAFSNALEITWS